MAERARILDILGARLSFGADAVGRMPDAPVDLVVTSPGWRPDQPLLAGRGRGRHPGVGRGRARVADASRRPAPRPGSPSPAPTARRRRCRCSTSILRAAGLRACSAGNVGTPILEAVLHPEPFDVIAVELSSFQLHWSHSIAPRASVCLNVAPDHVDWHGSFDEYAAAKGRVYARTEVACVYNVEDERTRRLVEEADVQEGCRAVGFTLGVPGLSEVGLVDDVLADRAFVEERRTSAAELATLDDLRGDAPEPAPHLVANALAAAALARAHGVPAGRRRRRAARLHPRGAPDRRGRHGPRPAVGRRLQGDQPARGPREPGRLRARRVGRRAACSRAPTSTTSSPARPSGCGASSSSGATGRRSPRRSPDTRRMSPSSTSTAPTLDAMDLVVREALELAHEGDVVLLAPAAASMDMFTDYGARGDAFVAAVRRLAAGE